MGGRPARLYASTSDFDAIPSERSTLILDAGGVSALAGRRARLAELRRAVFGHHDYLPWCSLRC
jgi:hypothetical protein